VQGDVPIANTAICLGVINLFMQLGLAVSVSAAQTIFRNQLPVFLKKYAPDIDAQVVIDAGATDVRKLVPPAEMPGFLEAYNLAIADMFVSHLFYPSSSLTKRALSTNRLIL
jgi:hypothetical protein